MRPLREVLQSRGKAMSKTMKIDVPNVWVIGIGLGILALRGRCGIRPVDD